MKDQLAPDDLRQVDLPIQAAAMHRRADQWIEREASRPGGPLTVRLQADPSLSPLDKALVHAKLEARASLQESHRVAAVKGLDDKLATVAHAVALAPATRNPGALTALANAYDDAGEPDRAAAMRRLTCKNLSC